MCSVNDSDFEDVVQGMVANTGGSQIGAVCRKCGEQKGEVLLRVRDVYCRQCFLHAATHKFRAVLGKSRMIKMKENVLIAFSGSQSSVALVHLVKSGLEELSHKRLQCSPYVLYIDEGAVLEQTQEDRQEICNLVAEFISKYEFPAFISYLDRSLNNGTENDTLYQNLLPNIKLDINEQGDKNIWNIINSVHSLTAKEDLLQKLRNQLLYKIAKRLDCCKIFVADTGTDLAIKLISNISLGRGAQLPSDIGFCDSRLPEVKILRPMRDFTRKEISFYNTFNHLEGISGVSLGTKANIYSSIQKLTEAFVIELQENFPSTVSTIFRTGDKLGLKSDSHLEDSCVLCQAHLDTSHVQSSSLQATEFSHMISALGPSGFDNHCLAMFPSNEKHHEEGLSCTDSPSTSCKCNKEPFFDLKQSEVEECLCYGCRLIIKEMKSLTVLPSDLVLTIKDRLRMKKMRNEIQDFLL